MNLSSNTALTYVDCSDNQLTSLNVKNGNNTNLISFSAINNPGLTCILVDNAAYMNSAWSSAKDASASYNDVSCCTVNIPDANFKAALVGNSAINTNLDGEIQCSEAAAFTGTIIVNSLNITDLTGVEAFTVLTILSCSSNQLTNLDVSANTSLTKLNCSFNQITNLDVSANTALTQLNCDFNLLTNLDVSANTALTTLTFGTNQLTNLDVSANTALISLACGTNSLNNIDVSVNTALTFLNCQSNLLTNLDVSANTALTILQCDNNQLTSLDVSIHTALTNLDCYGNLLTNLNIKNGNNTNFTNFNATNNPSLTCILVDNAAYMNSTWPSAKDTGASYNDVSCCSIVVDAGTDQTVCGSIGYATLNGSVSGNTTTGLWQTSGDGSFSPNNTTLSANYNFGPADIASGTTVLTLLSTNNGGCSAIQDDMILTIDVTSTFSGTINCAGFPADSVMVFLYEVTQTGNYVKKDSVETDVSGYYQFTLLPEGKYVAKAVPSLTKYPNYLPTYFLSTTGTTYWDQAFVDSLYCGVNPLAHNISLIQKVPQIGAWQCNGYIYEYYGFGARLAGNIQGIMAPGEPIPDIDITIDQSPGGTISSATTDVNGYFAFTGLNNNVTFVVRVDLPGYPNDSVYTFTVTPGDPALDSLNFYIDSVGVYIIPEGITSVNLITLEDYNINIVPNPTTQNFVMEITSTKHIKINVSLTNSLGQVVLSNQSNLNIGLNKVNFDIQNQPPGVYFMSINYENNHFIKKIIKQ